MKIQDAYIVDAARTPISNVRKGKSAYSEMHPVDLASALVKKLAERNSLKPEFIDDNRWAVTTPIAQQWKMGRFISLVGFGESVPGCLELREGGSGLDVIVSGIARASLGLNKLVIAGGSEDMSLVPLGADGWPLPKDAETIERIKKEGVQIVKETLPKSFFDKYKSFKTVLESAEIIAANHNITRSDQDQFALGSHQKASKAWANGFYKEEVIPIQTPMNGLFEKDDGVRSDSTFEKLAALKTLFQGGSVTPGNSSPLSVGAAGAVIANEDAVKEYHLIPKAKLKGYAVVGSNIEEQLTAPILAIPKALENAGLKLEDINLFQIGEAFATEVLAIQKRLQIPMEKINVNGGQIAIGHPPGATGVNLVITGLHELQRRHAAGEGNDRYILVVLCIGFGQSVAAIFERL